MLCRMEDATERTSLLQVNSTDNSYLQGRISNGAVVTDKEKDVTTSYQEGFSFKNTPRNKKILLIGMASINFFASTCFSLLAPFFPAEAAAKGVSQTVTGLIFGVFEFTIFISAPIFGNFVSKIGARFMFITGAMVCGACAILFGVLIKGPDGTVFIVMCFLCRTLEGLGASAYVTALFAIIAHEFPSSVATVFGSLESFSGLGAMVGPPIGGALYALGGYGLPFYVNGSVVILNGILCSYLIPHLGDADKHYSGSILSLLRSPITVITAFCITTGAFSLGFLDPTLSNHLSKFDLSTVLVGLVFLIPPGIYAFTAPLWGWISDTKKQVKSLMIFGNLMTLFAFLILGPTPLIPFLPYELWSVIIALIAMGFFLGCALCPTFKGLLNGASELWSVIIALFAVGFFLECALGPTFKSLLNGASQLGMPDNFDTYGIVSGCFNSCFSLGAFLGPTVGGVLVDKFQFGWASSFCSLLFGIAALLMSCYSLSKKFCCPIEEKKHNGPKQTIEVQNPKYSKNSDSVINV